MCARYTMRIASETMKTLFDLDEVPELEPRYNVAPTQDAPVVIEERDGTRTLHMMRWGLVPSWAKDPSIGQRMINAKSETVFEKPAFRDAARRHRCLIPCDGFYEWKDVPVIAEGLFSDLEPAGKTRKQPYHVTANNGGAFAMAGLFERWSDDGRTIETFTVLTCTPNSLVAQLHDRMPVILQPRDYDVWLSREIEDKAALRPLFEPLDASEMEIRQVNPLVGNPRFDTPDLLNDPS